ncbi:unnamed protein product [Arctogadus glacialis]
MHLLPLWREGKAGLGASDLPHATVVSDRGMHLLLTENVVSGQLLLQNLFARQEHARSARIDRSHAVARACMLQTRPLYELSRSEFMFPRRRLESLTHTSNSGVLARAANEAKAISSILLFPLPALSLRRLTNYYPMTLEIAAEMHSPPFCLVLLGL